MFKWLGGLVDSNEKELKRLQPIVNRINELGPALERLSDDALHARTGEFKSRLKAGSSLDELLPEAFAAVREAARRTINQRHFDVQLLGGIVLHQGKIAEMKTGEGKTLVATLPLYLNSLTGQGCHLATVNDYLARRDPYWMSPIYHALGVSVASIYPQQSPDEQSPARIYDPDYDSGDSRWRHFRPISRREAYQADIIYGTSSEFGFDYLRDNMVVEQSRCVQRQLNYAIVDEVDNLLIDEARTPLIISGHVEQDLRQYQVFAQIAARLERGKDYKVDEKERTIKQTEHGITTAENVLWREGILKRDEKLYGKTVGEELPQHIIVLQNMLRNALTAKEFYKKDQQYTVTPDKKVIIVDEFTGRLMVGRRYSEGLHQAIEAKHGVKIEEETRTYAAITIQNYFRMYEKLGGMTGTAATEAEEFHKIYNLEVVIIPTHKPMIREDFPDRIYKDEDAKFKAVVREVEELHRQGQPVLIGTVSIKKSEDLSDRLKRKGIPYQVLNAKNHEKEADIIAQAGRPGAVTVATNMAGRGVDIILGGNPEGRDENEWQEEHERIVRSGGFHIIGTERHEARRIDNQLRGRAGRQGDPGSTRFYASLEDDLVRQFGGDQIKSFMSWAGLDENTPIENKLVNKSIENAQVRVEGHHFDMRKHLVEYDDVVNQQRELIYAERKKILSGADLKANILSMVTEEIQAMAASHTGNGHGVDRDLEGLISDVSTIFPLPPPVNATALSQLKPEQIEERLIGEAKALYEEREKELGPDNMRMLERLVMLRTIDSLWIEHLTNMEDMRQQAGWQSLRQVQPVDAYKREGYKQFQVLLSTIQHDVAHTIYHVNIVRKEAPQRVPPQARGGKKLKVSGKKIGRNDLCPCGSGKKYKHCCG
ncbi:MAG: preprotein translocase subunit SecA, partial [Chloroflexota bacterium]|nr:preprotein translocase subunit SecA [Chloroflexota bacterium]